MELKSDVHWSTNMDMSNPQYSAPYHGYPTYPQMSQPDPKLGLQKLKTFGFVQTVLGLFTSVVGAVLLGYAAANIGFPVFNFGPLLVGIIGIIGGGLGFYGARTSIRTSTIQKAQIIANFSLNVTNISLTLLAATFALISGAVCAGANIVFYRRNSNGQAREQIDVQQYCLPHKNENTALAFIAAGLCLLLGIWSIFGTCLFCCYGRSFGFTGRRTRMSHWRNR